MGSYRVELTHTAEKQLRRLGAKHRPRVVESIAALAEHPRPRGARKLSGYDQVFRVRVGTYRIVYEVFDDRVVIIVLKIGHRKDIYR